MVVVVVTTNADSISIVGCFGNHGSGGVGCGTEAAGFGTTEEEAPSTETSLGRNTPVTGSLQISFPIKSLQTLELAQSARQIRFLNINEEIFLYVFTSVYYV